MATLSFWERQPPLAAAAAGKLANLDITFKPDPKGNKDTPLVLALTSEDSFTGNYLILRYIARSSPESRLYGHDALSSTQIDYFTEYALDNAQAGANFEAVCHGLNDYLAFRSYLVGSYLSIADLALWGQLQIGTMWKKVKGPGKVPHLSRWFDLVSELPACKLAVEEIDINAKKKAMAAAADVAAGGEAKSKASGETGSFDIDLPEAEMGRVVTRFPPEPSGFLHIGHAKAALLNQYIADMYKGKMLVRFDDTNPSKEKDEFVESILADIVRLGLRYEKLSHASDYFPQMLDCGEKLIRAGIVYSDDTPAELMKEERMNKIESKCRARTVEENLVIWEEMKKGSEIGLANCMRIKLNMKSDNGVMRDPAIFRCNLTPHWRTGTKYKVYPLYDFACPIVDSLDGVTHALRTSEYKDREELFYAILKLQQQVCPELRSVYIWDYSRLNFVNTCLSKRKLAWFVDTKRVEGWNDPRMPTVQGILRRGLQVEALKEFIISQGASKNVTYQEWDKIWTMNKKLIDPTCPRHTAIEEGNKVLVTLSNGPSELDVVTLPRHKKYPPAGSKSQLRLNKIFIDQADAQEVHDGEEVTLCDWGNCILRTIHKDPVSGLVTAIDAELHLEGDFKTTKWKLHWLSVVEELVPLQLSEFDHLITKKKMEDDDAIEAVANDNSRWDRMAHGDVNMRVLQKGEVIQLERKGYFIVDEPYTKPGKPIVLFLIPDGREKKVAFPSKAT